MEQKWSQANRNTTMKPYLICPSFGSDGIMENGTTRWGRQNHQCRDYSRQFVENPQRKPKDKKMFVNECKQSAGSRIKRFMVHLDYKSKITAL